MLERFGDKETRNDGRIELAGAEVGDSIEKLMSLVLIAER